MGTDSEEQCNAFSFSWQIPTYKISGLLRSRASPACTCGQLMDTARNRVEGLQPWGAGDKPLLQKSLGDRDTSAQCPQSVPWNRPKVKERVHSHDLGLPATGCRSGSMGYMWTDPQEECSLQLWCLKGLGAKGAAAPLSCLPGGTWPGPIRSSPSSV